MNGNISFTKALNDRLEILNINNNVIEEGVELMKKKNYIQLY